MTPYEVLYGHPPPLHLPYLSGDSKVDAVDRIMIDREETLACIKNNLLKAQNRMKQQTDKGRSDREFEEGEYVYLKLHPYRQQSVNSRANQKLAKKYYGPYLIAKKVGSVAYKLALPPGSKIHHTFHVSLLKRHYGPIPQETLDYGNANVPAREPELILAKKAVKRGRIQATKILVKWADSTLEDATWEFLYDMQKKYPNFDPWGQGSTQEGSIDALLTYNVSSIASTTKSMTQKLLELGTKELPAHKNLPHQERTTDTVSNNLMIGRNNQPPEIDANLMPEFTR